MEDSSGRSPIRERVEALRAEAARARERAHQRAVAADRLIDQAATAQRDAKFARERADRLCAEQLGRRAVMDFA
ncbi:hypothetical protein [Couchioplanes azureus]|uniref:hypothetical protein n=1 Tax=Couchioplanes caeruleus TaxID=56438 RepID=UPI0016711A7D|nr:hypothetical protein [Couchioplanes caeruleus]GGQ50899.1 hypothetical protein GCM10010166_19480 [Couchioplanes caeruleus subsp. azureus]